MRECVSSTRQLDSGRFRAGELLSVADRPFVVGSFSAGSNVTGIASDTRALSLLLHKYGALAVFDYAAAAVRQ